LNHLSSKCGSGHVPAQGAKTTSSRKYPTMFQGPFASSTQLQPSSDAPCFKNKSPARRHFGRPRKYRKYPKTASKVRRGRRISCQEYKIIGQKQKKKQGARFCKYFASTDRHPKRVGKRNLRWPGSTAGSSGHGFEALCYTRKKKEVSRGPSGKDRPS